MILDQSLGNDWLIKQLAKRYVYTVTYNENWNCQQFFEDNDGGNLQVELFCAGKNFQDYDTFSILIDMVYGDTTSPMAFEIGFLTSARTYKLMFQDWQNPKGVAGKINDVLVKVSAYYGCKTDKNKRTNTKICSDMEFFYRQYAKQQLTMDPYMEDAWVNHDKLNPVPSFFDWGLNIPQPLEYSIYQKKVKAGDGKQYDLTEHAVNKIFAIKAGLMEPKYGTLFVRNMTIADPKWIIEANLEWGTPVQNMYQTFRYMIENVWMSSAFQDKIKMADWLSGYQTTDYTKFMDGDYYRGAWKDLDGFVSPVFKENFKLLTSSTINIHTGNRDPN